MSEESRPKQNAVPLHWSPESVEEISKVEIQKSAEPAAQEPGPSEKTHIARAAGIFNYFEIGY